MKSKKRKGNTKLYNVYYGIKRRCLDKKWNLYKDYGGRGIEICDEWKNSYQCFKTWAIENGYKEGLSIERINNNGNYEPSNCKWATPKEQANNRRSNRKIYYEGKLYNVTSLAETLHINSNTLFTQLNRGWTIQRIIERSGNH